MRLLQLYLRSVTEIHFDLDAERLRDGEADRGLRASGTWSSPEVDQIC